MKRKIPTPSTKGTRNGDKYRIAITLLLSQEDFDLFEVMRASYNLSRSDLQYFGYKYMLELKKDVEGRIMLRDYVTIYCRTRPPYGLLDKSKKRKWPLIYVYNIEKIPSGQYLVFYKNNSDPDDIKFSTLLCGKNLMPDELREQFPTDILDAYKEVYSDK